MLPQKTIIGSRILKIIHLLKENLNNKLSIRKISQRANLSYDNCYKAIFDLSGRGIINIEKNGKVNYCSLKKSPETALLLAYVSFLETKKFLERKPNLRRAASQFLEQAGNHSYSIILFGSYAKEKERENSDIDILCLAEISKKSEILKEARFTGMKYDKRIQVIVADKNSLIEMLQAKEVNIGKEALNTGKVLFGFEQYWNIVMDALK